MAPDREDEMQAKFDKLQAALTVELGTQLEAMAAKLEDRIERRVDDRLAQRFKVQAEELREIVNTAAQNFGGVLDGIQRDLGDFRAEWQGLGQHETDPDKSRQAD